MSLITEALLIAAKALPDGAELYAEPLAKAWDAYGIVGRSAVITSLANVLNETSALTQVSEDLEYSSAEYLREVFSSHFPTLASAQPYVRNPVALAAKVYGGCQGRGGLMLTGAANYQAYAKAKGIALADLPVYLVTPDGMADSAAWFFVVQAKCLPDAMAGDLLGVTRKIEGGSTPIGWRSVQKWSGQVAKAIGAAAPQSVHPVAATLHAGASTRVAPAPAPQPTADELDAEFNPPSTGA